MKKIGNVKKCENVAILVPFRLMKLRSVKQSRYHAGRL
jgi:hypothetical protein